MFTGTIYLPPFACGAAVAPKHEQNASLEGDQIQKRQVLFVLGHSYKNMHCPGCESCVCDWGFYFLLKLEDFQNRRNKMNLASEVARQIERVELFGLER